MSGVYYVRAPGKSAKIVFEDPRPQAQVMIPAYKSYTPQNSARQPFEASEGMMLVFPSWLEHLVENNFPYTESELLVVELRAADDLNALIAALLRRSWLLTNP